MVKGLKKGSAYMFKTYNQSFDCLGIVMKSADKITEAECKHWGLHYVDGGGPVVVVRVFKYMKTQYSMNYIKFYEDEIKSTVLLNDYKAAQVLYGDT